MFFSFLKAIISGAELLFYMMPIFTQSVVLPDPNAVSGVSRVEKTRSIVSTLSAMGWDTVAVLGMTLAVVSAILAILSQVFKNQKGLKPFSTGAFIVSLLAFAALFFIAASSQPNY